MDMTALRLSAAFALAILLNGSLSGQAVPDSLTAWADRLRTGSLVERIDAAGKLAQEAPESLPVSVRSAMIGELNRINGLLINGTPVPGADELGDEFGEYYLDLVIPTAHFRTREATEALVASVGAGGGIQRRVARAGDTVVPRLVELIERGYQPGDGLETLALAWYWADSTGAALSVDSRAEITRMLVNAGQSPSYGVRRAAPTSLSRTGDPAFLPLADALLARARAANERLIEAALRRETLPALTHAAGRLTTVELSHRVQRVLVALCATPAPGVRRGECTSIQDQYAAALRHLVAGRLRSAEQGFSALQHHLGQPPALAAFTALERALLLGGVEMVMAGL